MREPIIIEDSVWNVQSNLLRCVQMGRFFYYYRMFSSIYGDILEMGSSIMIKLKIIFSHWGLLQSQHDQFSSQVLLSDSRILSGNIRGVHQVTSECSMGSMVQLFRRVHCMIQECLSYFTHECTRMKELELVVLVGSIVRKSVELQNVQQGLLCGSLDNSFIGWFWNVQQGSVVQKLFLL